MGSTKEEREIYCKVPDKQLRNYIYSRKNRIEQLEKALKRIIQKFQEPLYNGDPRQYETIEEIAERALNGQ